MREADIIRLLREQLGDMLEAYDWVLAVMYPSGWIRSELHLQKALFLAWKHIGRLRDVVEFRAYRMGPWSEEVKDSLEHLESSSLVERRETGLVLSMKGRVEAKRVWERLSEKERMILENIARLVNMLDRDELLLYIYVVHGYHEMSEVRDRILRDRVRLAIRMLMRGAVSVELAARLAGMPLVEFIRVLREQGIKPYTARPEDIDYAAAL